jgi:hypothetical protein
VLTHGDAPPIQRLVGRILALSPSCGVVVCHDARLSEPPVFPDDRVVVIDHGRRTDWGSWDLVLASLDGFAAARKAFDPELFVLVSGSDYPARLLDEWERTFWSAGGGWVGSAVPLAYRPRWGRPQGSGQQDWTRYAYRWFPLPTGRWIDASEHPLARALRWGVIKLGHYLEPALSVRFLSRGLGIRIGLRRVRTPFRGTLRCMKGSQWMALDRRLYDAVLRRHETERLLRSTYRWSVIPDESYLQSLLSALQPPQAGPPLSYVRWIMEGEEERPATLSVEELPAIIASGAPFCRKTAPEVSDGLLDALDNRTRR